VYGDGVQADLALCHSGPLMTRRVSDIGQHLKSWREADFDPRKHSSRLK
jgi:hypothetical protein